MLCLDNSSEPKYQRPPLMLLLFVTRKETPQETTNCFRTVQKEVTSKVIATCLDLAHHKPEDLTFKLPCSFLPEVVRKANAEYNVTVSGDFPLSGKQTRRQKCARRANLLCLDQPSKSKIQRSPRMSLLSFPILKTLPLRIREKHQVDLKKSKSRRYMCCGLRLSL